ncbi:uncharacterized protein EDB91DRAFT_1166682 [Suillus paluster]|uniref:uncharacterized protein n=1 Tax=Suillus paluster TaxID=48578 RepID=UPI001B871F86|nr:uncharacterized protein EDB91DRAFT_1166682 [Suillus paluster]KAG1726052.1 hypothetical protein EDB91DRAFT_1166682 [Suillus paluster]
MDPPRSNTTVRVATDLGPASQFANSPMTVIELKGRTPQEKGEHYLQLSLAALKELAGLLEEPRLSATDKATYHEAYMSNRDRYDDLVGLRDQILAQRKSFRKFIVNLFVRESDAKRFHKFTYRNYAAIKRTSEDLTRRLLPGTEDIFASGSPGGSAQGDVSFSEESPRDVVGGNILVRDLPPNETIRGINMDVQTEQEANDVLAMLNQIAISGGEEDEDDTQTIRPSTSQSRPPSPSPSFTINVYNDYSSHYNHSVVSLDSEMNGITINSGVNGGVGSHLNSADTNQHIFP